MKTYILIACFLAMASLAAKSQSHRFSDIRLTARVGFNLGGTAPVGLPASIRKLNSEPNHRA